MAPESGDPSGGDRPKPPPDYKVYKARRGLNLTKPDLGSLREKMRPKRDSDPKRPEPALQPEKTGRPWLKWIGIAIGGWLLLSLITFAISATIQKGKLADTGDALGGNPLLAASAQNILVLGTDVRSDEFAGVGESKKCLEQAASGETPSACTAGARADTLMVLRAGGGAF